MEYHSGYDLKASAVNLFRFRMYPNEFIYGLFGISLILQASSSAAVSETGRSSELVIWKGVENQRRSYYLPSMTRNREIFQLLRELPLPNQLPVSGEEL